MQKIILQSLAGMSVLAFIVVIYKLSSPFGLLFSISLNVLAVGTAGLIVLAGIILFRKRGIYYLPSILLLFISGVILILTVALNIDYRMLLPGKSFQSMTTEEWEADLEFLQDHLKSHPGYNTFLDSAVNQNMEILERNIRNSDEDEVLMEMIELIGLFRDGHSFVLPFQVFNRSRYFPLNGYYFDDGYYILNAASEYKSLVRKKMLKLGNMDIDELFNLIQKLTGPENSSNAKYRFDLYLYNSNLLRSLGIINNEELKISYLESGQEKEMTVRSSPFVNWLFWSLKPTSGSIPPSLKLRKPNFKIIQNNDIVELVINLIENISDQKTIKHLALELDNILAGNNIRKVIIDLRNNTGGNNQLYEPLIATIKKHDYINQRYKLFVFTSRTTFSAGINFLDDLKHLTNATLIGQPVGAGPTHYGDANFVTLPNSKIFFFLSTKQWKGHDGSDTSRTIYPDFPIEYDFLDYVNGVDPWKETLPGYD